MEWRLNHIPHGRVDEITKREREREMKVKEKRFPFKVPLVHIDTFTMGINRLDWLMIVR